jgi:transposase InsO family protein
MSKQRVIIEAVLSGKSQREVARLYGISQPRVSQLLAAWRAGGWDALEPKSRRPRTNPNATPPDVVDRILKLRAALIGDGCDAGPHTIAGILDDEMDSPPAVTTIWRILTRAGVITPEPRKRPKRSWIRFEADLPNECWQADFTHIPLADGTHVEVLLWVDDHSRYLISATAHKRVTGPIVVTTFRAACTIHGTPQSTLTDNGFVFTTRFRGGPNGFEVLLANLGITQKNGSPNHPQTQGKVECMDAQGFLAALTPAVTDADARERFLADPKAVLAAAGLDLPQWFTVTAREGDATELTITVPALLDPDADLTEEQLATVSGGWPVTHYPPDCWCKGTGCGG